MDESDKVRGWMGRLEVENIVDSCGLKEVKKKVV